MIGLLYSFGSCFAILAGICAAISIPRGSPNTRIMAQIAIALWFATAAAGLMWLAVHA